jgi:hypothetical protein
VTAVGFGRATGENLWSACCLFMCLAVRSFFISRSLFYLHVHSRCRGFVISFDHTQTHTTVGRAPLDEGSARRRDL